MSNVLKIATRKSPLALWQAEYVKAELKKLHPNLTVELVPMTSQGDQILDVALSKVGGKGLFVKELEVAMANGEADIAVHSMKDVPMVLPSGFELPVICPRENPFDAFVSNHYKHIDELPEGARVGTSSLRRQAQLLAQRPDLNINFLRGNVGTRLSKLDAGEHDAIILACAGLIRLGLENRIVHALDERWCLPAVGQGAVGIETRQGDQRVIELIKPLEDKTTTLRVSAERAMNRRLNGGCQVPIAGFSRIDHQTITLEGRVGSEDGQQLLVVVESIKLTDEFEQDLQACERMGLAVAEALLAKGAGALLAHL